MKKVAQPEHAYTGYVPRWTEEASPEPEKRRHAPILGYKGHLRHAEDCVGTTFTRGVEIAARPGVLTASDIAHGAQTKSAASAEVSCRRVQHGGEGSGYGEFARASGYGEFAAPGSGYGAFEHASGYGAFQAPPDGTGGSGYGAFDAASGYGAFQAPPNGNGGSGYGAFDAASGYGDFAAPAIARGGSGYGEFDGASGYGQFMEAASNQERVLAPSSPRRLQGHSPRCRFPDGSVTGMRYTQAIRACGGEDAVKKLWLVAARTISQRYIKRTELLQAVKRSFEKRERESALRTYRLFGSPTDSTCVWHVDVIDGGRMTKEHLKEALQSLSCILNDDQVVLLQSLVHTEKVTHSRVVGHRTVWDVRLTMLRFGSCVPCQELLWVASDDLTASWLRSICRHCSHGHSARCAHRPPRLVITSLPSLHHRLAQSLSLSLSLSLTCVQYENNRFFNLIMKRRRLNSLSGEGIIDTAEGSRSLVSLDAVVVAYALLKAASYCS